MSANGETMTAADPELRGSGWSVRRSAQGKGYRELASEKVQITAVEGSWGRVLLRFADGCIWASLPTMVALRLLSSSGIVCWLLFCTILSALWAILCSGLRQIEIDERCLHLKEGRKKVSIGIKDLQKILVQRSKNGFWAPAEGWAVVVLDSSPKPRQLFGRLSEKRAESVAQFLAKELKISWERKSFVPSTARLVFSTVGIVILIIVTSCSFICFTFREVLGGMDDWQKVPYQPGIHLLHDELALKSVGVRQCALRLGHLPDSLTECESDIASTSEWLRACQAQEKDLDEYGEAVRRLAPEKTEENLKGDDSAIRKGWQDVLGLPVIYHRGKRQVAEIDKRAQFSSDEPLPSLVQGCGQSKVGPVPNSQEPFVLSSVTGQGIIDYIQNTGLYYRVYAASGLAGIAWLVLGGLCLMRQAAKLPKARVVLYALCMLPAAFVTLDGFNGPFFHPEMREVQSTSLFWLVPPEWRLEMMLHAPWDQKIPAEFRKKAEDYIQNRSQEN